MKHNPSYADIASLCARYPNCKWDVARAWLSRYAHIDWVMARMTPHLTPYDEIDLMHAGVLSGELHLYVDHNSADRTVLQRLIWGMGWQHIPQVVPEFQRDIAWDTHSHYQLIVCTYPPPIFGGVSLAPNQ